MYATSEYYKDKYQGTIIAEDELGKALEDAEDDVNHLCLGRIQSIGFESLYPRQQELICKAVCRQADYIKQYGAYLESPMKGYSAGSTRVDLKATSSSGVSTTPKVIQLLEDTGLRCQVL